MIWRQRSSSVSKSPFSSKPCGSTMPQSRAMVHIVTQRSRIANTWRVHDLLTRSAKLPIVAHAERSVFCECLKDLKALSNSSVHLFIRSVSEAVSLPLPSTQRISCFDPQSQRFASILSNASSLTFLKCFQRFSIVRFRRSLEFT